MDCFNCVDVCPNGANRIQEGKLLYNRDRCTVCGACITACSAGAREPVGDDATVEQILKTITRDAVFYRSSGGGVTFSGGEPFAQPELLRYLVKGCFKAGIQMAVETCGHFNYANVEDIFDYIDDILIDFKHSDPDCHRRLTGVSNERIIANILKLDEAGRTMTIRIPLLQGINDTRSNIDGVVELCTALTSPARIELLPYHDYGSRKYQALDLPYDTGMAAPSVFRINSILDLLQAQGIEAKCGDADTSSGKSSMIAERQYGRA